jgi:hypothetical protein
MLLLLMVSLENIVASVRELWGVFVANASEAGARSC